jgi:hypothetical protein
VFRRKGINQEGKATYEELGEHLLRSGKITKEEYDATNKLADNYNKEKKGKDK